MWPTQLRGRKFFRTHLEEITFLNFYIMYYAVIYNRYNNIARIEERPTIGRAEKAAEYFARMLNDGWWAVLEQKDNEWLDAYKKGCWL